MMRAAAVRICFPSPSGFGGIGETAKVAGVAADDSAVFDIVRWVGILLRVWMIACAESLFLRMRMRDKVRKAVTHYNGLGRGCFLRLLPSYALPEMQFISASCLLTGKYRSHALTSLTY